MCGILGWIGASASPELVDRFVRASSLLTHRGPDDEGLLWLPFDQAAPVSMGGPSTPLALNLPKVAACRDHVRGPGALFGHRRLAILDVSPAGHQPMAAANGRVWVVFNGEIYNYRELRDELSHSHQFITGSDTEVLLAAYLEWGPSAAKRFVGMFAFAIVDTRDRERPLVVMGRDPFGIKPLYYTHIAGDLVFASEIKALLALGAPARCHATRLFRFLENGVTDYGDSTMFAGIHQVEPAHIQIVHATPDVRMDSPNCYWHLDVTRPPGGPKSAEEAARMLRDAFLASIKLHLRSDVPLGTALSGGIDSTSIVAGIRAVEPAARIEAFGYIAEDARLNEEKWIVTAAQHTGARLHRCQPDPNFFGTHLDEFILTQELPFGSTSIIAQWHVFQAAAAAGIKVMLDGQGADEMLAGYGGYPSRRLESLVRAGHLSEAVRFWRSAGRQHGPKDMALELAAYLAPSSVVRAAKHVAGLRAASAALNRDWFRARNASPDLPGRPGGADRLRSELWHSVRVSSLPMLLRFEDRNSMAHSVESRVPFLTTHLAETIFSLPEELLVDDHGTTKSVMRRAMRGLVPDTILDRRDKIGFATPERQWLLAARPWVERQLADLHAGAVPALLPDVVENQWRNLDTGRSRFDFRFWRWLNVIAWSRLFSVSFS
jgi:asparagine synthase (glutamine-hydrolysing)